MKLNFKDSTATPNDLSMIPLINVVFLILAFLMVVGEIKDREESSKLINQIELPESSSDTDREPLIDSMTVDANGQITVQEAPISRADLSDRLTELANAPNPPDLTIYFDGKLQALQAKEIINLIRNVGITEVILATQVRI